MECLTSFFWFVKIYPKSDNLNKNLAARIMYDTEVWFKYINKIFYKSCTKKKIREEINEIETEKAIAKPMKRKAGFLRRQTKLINL